jgi:hypothetical protein
MPPRANGAHPRHLARWELWLLAGLAALCLVLALTGLGRREEERYERFLERAPRIEKALKAFAADHQGKYPPDATFTRRPPGLDDEYIDWSQDWLIDYDVHPNGQGGRFVCLEFCGPTGERHYYGLCNDPELRARFGRGEAIPGHANRIWVVEEQAEIADPGQAGPD